ncbi:protein SEEDLING LETHAL 1, chloroplastic-like [Bidens hawaiensis]|uniref:protein SEEDLING LETHAL 1, chloroplastic-like n=1 Tax=Bidens hawaiensis TaxID=980011 RepID=UPI00404A5456
MEVPSSLSLISHLFDSTSSKPYNIIPITIIRYCSSSSSSAALPKQATRAKRPSAASTPTLPPNRPAVHLNKVEEFKTKGFAYNPPPTKTTLISQKPSPPPPISATTATIDLQEKLLYLDSFGINLVPLLTTHPPLITTPLPHIKSTIAFLSTTINLSPPALNRLINLTPEILTLPLSSIIATVTFLHRECHVSTHQLRHIIHRRPRLLTSDVKTRLRPTLYFLQGTIGISEINKHAHLLSCSVEDKLIPRIEYFNDNIGISYDDTILIFRRFPSLFCYSIKNNLEPKFNYFVVEMGRDLKELVEFPQYFSFSLEDRIKRRHLRCVEKGVCLPLPAMLRSSEKRFMERLEVCCDSSLPVRNSPFWKFKHSDYH